MNYVIMEKATKPLNILIWDLRWGTEHAKRLGEDGNKVRYYTEWVEAEPRFQKYAVGLGVEKIKKVRNFFRYVDESDLIMFIALGHGDECDWLRKKGYTVYGAGRGERLEMDRGWALQMHKQVGLPVPPHKEIMGISNVLKYLEKENEGKMVKVDIFRHDISSFNASDMAVAKLILSGQRSILGPFDEDFEYLVQDRIEGIETGWDLWFNGHDYLKPYMWGYAGIEKYYIGKWTEKLPDMLDEVKEKIKPILIERDYRGAISVEIIVDKDGNPFVIDWTCRFAYPLSYIYTYAIKNYTEVVYACAKGQDVRIQPAFPFVGDLEFNSDYAQQDWMTIDYPPKYRNQIKISQPVKNNGELYVAPVDDLMTGAVVGGGKNWKTMVEEINKISATVKAYDVGEKPSSAPMEKIEETLKQGEKLGLKFI